MQIQSLAIPDVKIITPVRHADERGFFSEVYNSAALLAHGIDIPFVQDNQSLSVPQGTVRGLHFQTAPFAQAKLVRVLRGAIFDVAVDLRQNSPTFGQHVSAVLTAAEGNQILVPIGFAHGFATLEPNTEILYKVSAPYSREHDKGLLWNDAALGIAWPVAPEAAVLSAKDRAQPTLTQIGNPF
ncbi:dTDP-4-dehydrorhamnose 3,5-epimerase [Devosia sp. 1566]|uniref:dTDP-4-dehydrorhamnose 3,5-epimerase n=1 Tax=Devosia sp. 1566 TaxID=2499144 RepID=UPI000FDA76A6|nr:dTDP-4-dehydrorhamnose 3,5-epimerase [Devosia sp. 1566]